jgi:tRNA (mo5U34)-methyltransferase
LQSRIDAINWYHEFDFGNGLRAGSRMADADAHKHMWGFIEGNLNGVDFAGKSVLDIGCWDGYWSFLAEKRGAGSVLAADDDTQNWSGGGGIVLARELLNSSIEVNLNLSVYDLTSLERKFDIILFLGVYYHLFDPFYALAQIRHCCHRDTLVLIEGPEAVAFTPGTARYNFADHCCEWLPTRGALEQVLEAAYLRVLSATPDTSADEHPKLPGRRYRLRLIKEVLRDSKAGVRDVVREMEPGVRRVFLRCAPFEGENRLHCYPPPFGLQNYDGRFRS